MARPRQVIHGAGIGDVGIQRRPTQPVAPQPSPAAAPEPPPPPAPSPYRSGLWLIRKQYVENVVSPACNGVASAPATQEVTEGDLWPSHPLRGGHVYQQPCGMNVRFIGMMPAEPPAGWVAPDFWPELDGRRPVVHVTQGTVANEKPDLIAPALQGLADEDALVVISTGKRPVESLGLGRLPANARVATFLSYPELLPKTAVMVTNGGYGGVQIALSHGVPLVVAGTSEDKPEVAARVAWAGAGLHLRTARPKPEAVRRAVRTVLRDPRYRERAQALARRYREHDALASAIALVEEAAARKPQA